MARYKLILAYDGTEFFGFQRQAKARTVQGVVEDALRQIGWQGRSILAAGRTDTGVHAYGQVVALDLEWSHPIQALQAAINTHLPPDTAVREVTQTGPDFHPRFDAQSRRYQYRIFSDAVRDPLRERYGWRVWPQISPDLLAELARQLSGTHDFAAFGSPPHAEGETLRTVFEARWFAAGADWVFEITANAFLYHMVRRLVFAQVAIGQGRLAVDTVRRCLQDPASGMLQGLAPPQGLALMEVTYSQETQRKYRSRRKEGEHIAGDNTASENIVSEK